MVASRFWSFVKSATPGPVKKLGRSLLDPEKRYQLSARLRPAIHQTTAYTSLDRYPETFGTVRVLLEAAADVRVLSFGCSTGEEVVTLRRYFPSATIVGAEINRTRLKRCRRLGLDRKIHFVHSTPEEIAAGGPYDAIFAMAVLQRLPHVVLNNGIRNIGRQYPFERFERQLHQFDDWLRIGGLIAIENSQYRFRDCAISSRYEVCGYRQRGAAIQHFDRQSELIEGETYTETIFRKRS